MASRPDEPEPSAETAKASAAAEPEEPLRELEVDAVPDNRKQLPAGAVGFHTEDTTLNVLPVLDGQMLTCLSDGGFQYLLAGARASVGVKEGRFAFEVVIVESKDPSEPAHTKTNTPRPRQLVCVGVSTATSSLLLPDAAESVCFDSEGFFSHEKQRQKVTGKFRSEQIMAVVLNLDSKSQHFNTISLFCDGARVSQPQALPERMHGKPLYPCISFRNVSVRVNFGTELLCNLPFTCLSWQEAPQAACEVKAKMTPRGGKYEVLFPVGLPEEGTYDWLDQFLSQNKHYVEISDRSILDWAARSGVQRPKGYAQRTCVDKPEMDFGIPSLDDLSVKRIIDAIAPAMPRNYVVMDVQGNLTRQDRQNALARFSGDAFRRVAEVHVGEPPVAYRKWVQEQLLLEKRGRAEAEAKRKRLEVAKKKAAEETRRKAEEMRKKKLSAMRAVSEGKDGDRADEEAAAEEDGKDEMEVEKSEAQQDVEIMVELTEEEKSMCFRKKAIPDLTQRLIGASYSQFTLPSKEEGFDQIKYAWSPEGLAQEYLAAWMREKKLNQRIEDLEPSEWFSEQLGEWTKALHGWKRRQSQWNDAARKRATALRNTKGKGKEQAAKVVEETANGQAEEPTNGDETVEASMEQEAAQDNKLREDGERTIDPDDLEVFSVEDVNDIGNGEPLFARFAYEDWVLLGLRYELHLLTHAFARDVEDPESSSLPDAHLAFYYQKYFGKELGLKSLGIGRVAELVDLLGDALELRSRGAGTILEAEFPEDTPLDNFLKLAEEHRRERASRTDAGDDSAALRFAAPAPAEAAGGAGVARQDYGHKRELQVSGPGYYGKPGKMARKGGKSGAHGPYSDYQGYQGYQSYQGKQGYKGFKSGKGWKGGKNEW